MPIQLELFDYIPGYHQEAILNGKRIAFTRDSKFLIQTGKGKSSYKTRYSVIGSLEQAVMYYNLLNIGNGYKKRLIAEGFNKPILARQLS